VLGGMCIVIGLGTLGYKVMLSIGVRVIKITPSRGFAIEMGAAAVVVGASRVSIQVGATCGVGSMETESRSSVNWMLFVKVIAGWVVTLIFSGVCSALLFSFAAYSPAKGCVV